MSDTDLSFHVNFGYAGLLFSKKTFNKKRQFAERDFSVLQKALWSYRNVMLSLYLSTRKSLHNFSLIFDWYKENRVGQVQKRNKEWNSLLLSQVSGLCSSAVTLIPMNEFIKYSQRRELSFHFAKTGMFWWWLKF